MSESGYDRLLEIVDITAARFSHYYEAVGWIWSRFERPPNQVEIAAQLRELIAMRRAAGGDGRSSTGGLVVWREGDEFGLSFTDDISVARDF